MHGQFSHPCSDTKFSLIMLMLSSLRACVNGIVLVAGAGLAEPNK
jgi:hypothetical protein